MQVDAGQAVSSPTHFAPRRIHVRDGIWRSCLSEDYRIASIANGLLQRGQLRSLRALRARQLLRPLRF